MPPDPALLSSSSPYRAPSPVWPSSRSSREQVLRTAAASPRLRPAGACPEPGAPRGITRTLLAAPASAHPQTRGRLPTDCVMFSSLAACHLPPDTLFSWVFQLFFLIFLALLPGSALQAFPWSRARGCGRALPRWHQQRSDPEGLPNPLGYLLLPALEPLVPVWNSTCRAWSAAPLPEPRAGGGAGSSIRIPSMFQWSAVNQERRAGSPSARWGGRGAESGRTGTWAGGILGCFPGERWEEGLLLLLPAGNRERENS